MMEIFGLIQRNRLPLSVPYLPGYSGLPGVSGLTPLGGLGGLSPLSASGFGGAPGLTAPPVGLIPGTGVWTGPGTPGFGGLPGNWAGQGYPGWQANSRLDGIWELDNGGVALIRGNAARLYVSRVQYQDFAIHYDAHSLWWQPHRGGRPSHYRYQIREGRMILQDEEGNLLLMRRRR